MTTATDQNIRALAADVRASGIPRDAWQVAAHLEVMGMRDDDAVARYGRPDLFALARDLFPLAAADVAPGPGVAHEDSLGAKLLQFLGRYARGSVFALPMLIQSAAMLAWGFGLWGAVAFDVRTATAIALGFAASYVMTGGFIQSIVRSGLFYVYQQEEALTRWVVLRGCAIACAAIATAAVAALAFNAAYRLLPWDLFFTALLYFVALSLLWLSWSIIYVSRKRYWIPVITIVALGVVAMAANVVHWPMIAANAAGLVAAAGISFAVGFHSLPGASGAVHNPPRLTVLVFTGSSHFLYGLLYGAFIFADRIVAWSSQTAREDSPLYAFWLNARYELGMDLALIVIIILSGFVEAATGKASERFVLSQKSIDGRDRAAFVSWFRAFYRRRVVILSVAAVAAVVIARAAVSLAELLPDADLRRSVFSTTARFTFWAGAIGYAALALALQNVLLLLTLSRTATVVRALAISLAVNLVVGFAASRAIHYAAASLGLVAGSIVLCILTFRAVAVVTDDLDYYYFSAF